MAKYEKDKEVTEQEHENHCYLWVITFKQRTQHSCNCNKKATYKENFNKRRNNHN